MENFIVSARKYRPATFDSVVGQINITTTLKNAIKNNHLAQAFLFCGPRGVGKTTCARILAKTINCKNINENIEACDQCESCVSFNTSHSFNIHELDAASNNGVEEIRSIIEQVRIAPQVGKFSVYIIDEVHMLSASAFNAFLKTLEEPPPYAIFILATTSKQKIIPTILSRCQIYDFNRIGVDDIANHLGFVAKQEKIELEQDAAHMIAQKADGSLRDSLSIFDQIVSFAGNNVTYSTVIENLNILDYDYYFKVMNSILKHDIPGALTILDEILEKGFDGHNFITGLSEHFRNLLVVKDPGMDKLLETGGGIRDKYKEQAQLSEPRFLIDALSIANKCDVNYNINVNKRLCVELALLQLCSLGLARAELPSVTNTIAPPAADAGTKEVKEPKPEYQKGDGAKSPMVTQDETTAEVEAQVKKEPSDLKAKVEKSPDNSDKETADVEIKPPSTIADESAQEEGENTSVHKEEPVTETISPTKRPASRTISINKVKQNEKSEAADEQGGEERNEEGVELSLVDPEKFMDAWNKFANRVYENGQHSLCSTLTKRKPIIHTDNIVELPIDNIVQEAEVNAIKTDIQLHLKEVLGVAKPQIITTIIKEGKSKKPYTALEKYNRMAEKNPSIDQLREQLGLDLD